MLLQGIADQPHCLFVVLYQENAFLKLSRRTRCPGQTVQIFLKFKCDGSHTIPPR